MVRLLVAFLLAVSLMAPGALMPSSTASCAFMLGFLTLHDLLPGQVGECVDDETYSPTDGDTLQHTTGGLLVWRKLDNWSAFTDGYHTWVNGPYGVQERLNSQRFAWEANPVGLPIAPQSAGEGEAAVPPRPLPLTSRGVPAFASPGESSASAADDAGYDSTWQASPLPAWLAYDLSNVPPAQRQMVLVVYYSNTYGYGNIYYPHHANAGAYTIEGNKASGGALPADGWTVLVHVTDNTYHSRQHILNLSGYNWIRMVVTASDRPEDNAVSLNLDVYDASHGVQDDWIFYGDSITADGTATIGIDGTGTFSQLINATLPAYFPVAENGGMPYQTSADGAARIETWLAQFAGHYVGLAFGTNDALACVDPDQFAAHYAAMVQAVLRAGKVPMVPTIPWGRAANIQSCAPALNAKLRALAAAYPQILPGPDLWTFFEEHQSLIRDDGVHPTWDAYRVYRQLWVDQALRVVYGRPPTARLGQSLIPRSAGAAFSPRSG